MQAAINKLRKCRRRGDGGSGKIKDALPAVSTPQVGNMILTEYTCGKVHKFKIKIFTFKSLPLNLLHTKQRPHLNASTHFRQRAHIKMHW